MSINLIFKKFYPSKFIESVLEIDYEEMFNNGIRALLFDVDNTLAPYDVAHPPEQIKELFKKLTGLGFKIALISNNNNVRLEIFGAGLDAAVIPNAKKPGLKGVRMALVKLGVEAAEAVLIGDQIFTDIWCANRAGILSILVNPISKREEYYIKLKRVLEYMILFFYKRSTQSEKSNIASNIKRDYNDSGFTLVECTIALAIGAVIASIVLYALPSSGMRELEEACRTLQADLRMAQRLSVAEGQRYTVNFNFVNNSYTLGRRVSSSVTKVVKKRIFDGRVMLVYKTGNTSKVEYTPTGTTGDPCKIVLENDKYTVNLTVNLGSGRIEIKEYIRK